MKNCLVYKVDTIDNSVEAIIPLKCKIDKETGEELQFYRSEWFFGKIEKKELWHKWYDNREDALAEATRILKDKMEEE